jgi:hypothetical protein
MNFKKAHENLKKLANGNEYSIEYELKKYKNRDLMQGINMHIRLDNDDFLQAHQSSFEAALASIAHQLKGRVITENLENITDDEVVA